VPNDVRFAIALDDDRRLFIDADAEERAGQAVVDAARKLSLRIADECLRSTLPLIVTVTPRRAAPLLSTTRAAILPRIASVQRQRAQTATRAPR
jgi:hypothetical protein